MVTKRYLFAAKPALENPEALWMCSFELVSMFNLCYCQWRCRCRCRCATTKSYSKCSFNSRCRLLCEQPGRLLGHNKRVFFVHFGLDLGFDLNIRESREATQMATILSILSALKIALKIFLYLINLDIYTCCHLSGVQSFESTQSSTRWVYFQNQNQQQVC